MSLQAFFESLTTRLQHAATVRTVYGDPITAEGRTIVPVARVGFGFGGGAGGSTRSLGDAPPHDAEAGGGGGGVGVQPVGVVELTVHGTRFVPIHPGRQLAAAVAAGVLVGWIAGRCRARP